MREQVEALEDEADLGALASELAVAQVDELAIDLPLFRKSYFDRIARLPAGSLLAGSDFPVPVFELSANLEEHLQDFKAMMRGDLSRIVVPQGNLLDVNWHELQHAFPGHAMFTNFIQLM
jgi:hypothetical protein